MPLNPQLARGLTKAQKAFLVRLLCPLRDIRHWHGMTLRELAQGTEFSPADFARVERGQALPSERHLRTWLRRLLTIEIRQCIYLRLEILSHYRKILRALPARPRRTAR